MKTEHHPQLLCAPMLTMASDEYRWTGYTLIRFQSFPILSVSFFTEIISSGAPWMLQSEIILWSKPHPNEQNTRRNNEWRMTNWLQFGIKIKQRCLLYKYVEIFLFQHWNRPFLFRSTYIMFLKRRGNKTGFNAVTNFIATKEEIIHEAQVSAIKMCP